MINFTRLWPLLIVWLAACDQQAQTVYPSQTVHPSQTLPLALYSATYNSVYNEPVTLTDGRYEGPPFLPGAASRPELSLLATPWLRADLNGDDAAETVVLLAESSGGSGTFVYMAVMGSAADGFPNLATTLLGDRVEVTAIDFENGLLSIAWRDLTAASTGTLQQRSWRFVDSELQQVVEIAGKLIMGHEVREFTDCDDERSVWVLDSTQGRLGAVLETFAPAPYQPLFVVVRGVLLPAPEAEFARSYTQQLQILELLRAEREGFGCRLDLGDARYRARGVEPFWQLDVTPQQLNWSSLGGDERVFERQHPARQGLEFAGVEASGGQLQLTLQQAACTDPMSGSLYQLRAEVNLDGAVFSGCAVTPLPAQ